MHSLTTQQRQNDPRHNLADFYYTRTRVLITVHINWRISLHNKHDYYTGPLHLLGKNDKARFLNEQSYKVKLLWWEKNSVIIPSVDQGLSD
jgi:hypothetical protein